MDRDVAILKCDKTNNKKELVYIVSESIFDIQRKNASNLYAFKQLVELERLAKGDDSFSYEFKLINEEDFEIYMANCILNDKKSAPHGSFFSFLIYYSRQIDEFINDEPSKIIMTNHTVQTLIDWAKRNLKEQNDDQISIKQLKRGNK